MQTATRPPEPATTAESVGSGAVSRAVLAARLSSFPRFTLADYPTPLVFLPRMSKELGRGLYIKRDDQIGPGLGGNKTRKLEYLLAEAQRSGQRKVATFGGPQSNHVRLTAAAARLAGLEPHLFFFERRPERLTGNLLVGKLLGAQLHFIPIGGGGGMSIEASIRLARAAALARIGPHYFIPVGGHSWLGALGYVAAALELDEQARALGIPDARLVLAAGSGGTLAGLLAGLALTGSRLRPLAIDVTRLWRGFPGSVARLANEVREHLSNPARGGRAEDLGSDGAGRGARPGSAFFTPAQVPLIEGRYVGDGYAVPSAAGDGAIRRLAQTEAVILDPVYTGKAFAGLLDLVERGAIAKGEPVIFLHTGGLPALFA